MVEEGLSICKAVHQRYDPVKRNPYNEVECSDHYSRAMASWGVFTALSGFEYDGPSGKIGFAPKVTPHDFRAAFTTAEGWGTYSQNVSNGSTSQTFAIQPKWGKVRLKELKFESDLNGAVSVRHDARHLKAQVQRDGRSLRVTLEEPITLKPKQALRVIV